VAGATIAIRVMMFTMMPAWGMSNAAATLVGQNLGAQRPGARRGGGVADRLVQHGLPGAGVGAVLRLPRADRFFTADAGVIAIGAEWLRILSYSLFVYGWWMVSVQAFNGAGDTTTPTWINVVFFWLIQIPLAWWLARGVLHSSRRLGPSGVFWAVFV
jgi:Na+-driven multidrug efflux pump